MDPDALLRSILSSFAGTPPEVDPDIAYSEQELVNKLRDLADWIGRGGYRPKVHRTTEGAFVVFPANYRRY